MLLKDVQGEAGVFLNAAAAVLSAEGLMTADQKSHRCQDKRGPDGDRNHQFDQGQAALAADGCCPELASRGRLAWLVQLA